MSYISTYISKLRVEKSRLCQLLEFDNARNCRDVERFLMEVEEEKENIFSFLKFFKSKVSYYTNYNEIYEIIKSLDIKDQRRLKIEKIEKLH